MSSLESFATQPLQSVVPSYLYYQYSDDADLQAFVQVFNEIAQGYLDWFNQTPLGVYTSSNISGPLLDWVGNNLYGIARPTVGAWHPSILGAMGTTYLGQMAMGAASVTTFPSNAVLTDDLYKRVLTWHTYRGDGKQMTIPWIKRRCARFIYGTDGGDIDIGLIANVGVTFGPTIYRGEYDSVPYDDVPYDGQNPVRSRSVTISVPSLAPGSHALQALIQQGSLALPFQLNFSVAMT